MNLLYMNIYVNSHRTYAIELKIMHTSQITTNAKTSETTYLDWADGNDKNDST